MHLRAGIVGRPCAAAPSAVSVDLSGSRTRFVINGDPILGTCAAGVAMVCSGGLRYLLAGMVGRPCAAATSALLAIPFRNGCVSSCRRACAVNSNITQSFDDSDS